MPQPNQPFSKPQGYTSQPQEINLREDAPENLRYFVLETARELDWAPSSLRPIICHVLREVPDRNNWSEFPNIWDEVQGLIYGCDETRHAHSHCTPARGFTSNMGAGLIVVRVDSKFLVLWAAFFRGHAKALRPGGDAFNVLKAEQGTRPEPPHSRSNRPALEETQQTPVGLPLS
jgi:hypothetical protein